MLQARTIMTRNLAFVGFAGVQRMEVHLVAVYRRIDTVMCRKKKSLHGDILLKNIIIKERE